MIVKRCMGLPEHAGHVFVGDFVRCHTQGGNLATAKVMQYFMKVKLQECGNLYV